MDINQYRIGELVEKANVTKRTIHYYVGRGLLPPPLGAGLGTTYSDEHLYRVLLIKKLQDAYLPLEEIKKRMTEMNLDDVKRCLEGGTVQLEVQERAAEYNINRNETAEVKNDMDTADSVPGLKGVPYERLEVGLGLEIHFPSNNTKGKELAEMLYRYARKIMKES